MATIISYNNVTFIVDRRDKTMSNMMIRFGFILFVLMLGLSACSDNDNEPLQSKEPTKTVIDPQLKALEKAKAVEQQLLDAAEQQRKLIDAQGNH